MYTSGGLAEVRYVGSWVRKVSAATVLRLACREPFLPYAATMSSIAVFACGAERLDCRVTSPLEELLPEEVEVTQPLSSAAVPAAPSPASSRRRLG